ncbi:hypothetical protein ABK040_006814 [Willaertia magna]
MALTSVTKFKESIGDLVNLTFLDISPHYTTSEKINTNFLQNLKNLETLNISYFYYRDEDFYNLKNLKKLYILGNNILSFKYFSVHHIKELIDTNKLTCIFFGGFNQIEPLTLSLQYLNNYSGCVHCGLAHSFQIDYNNLLQQAQSTNSFHLQQFLNEYGNDLKEFYSNVKPQNVFDLDEIPSKINLDSSYCTCLPLEDLTKPNDWIVLATSMDNNDIVNNAIVLHKEKKVLFNYWYGWEAEVKEFSKNLMHYTMIKYLLFDHCYENKLFKDKLKKRLFGGELGDIDFVMRPNKK